MMDVFWIVISVLGIVGISIILGLSVFVNMFIVHYGFGLLEKCFRRKTRRIEMVAKFGYGIVQCDSDSDLNNEDWGTILQIVRSYEFENFCRQHGIVCTSWLYEDCYQWALLDASTFITCYAHEVIHNQEVDESQILSSLNVILDEMSERVYSVIKRDVKIPIKLEWHLIMGEM